MKGKEYYNKLADLFGNTGYLNSSIRNPSNYYRHIANLIDASDNAMFSMFSIHPKHLVMAYMDSFQCSNDSEFLMNELSCLDGARDIKSKAETFYSEKINQYSNSDEFKQNEDKYIVLSSSIPTIQKSGNIIIEVNDTYKRYFNNINNLKSTFNFLEYVEKQIGYPVSWEDDGYFVIHAPKDANFQIEIEKLLPKVTISDNDKCFASKYSKNVTDKYSAIIADKSISLGYLEIKFYVDDTKLPLELNDQVHTMEKADFNDFRDYKIGDQVFVTFGFSKNNIRINKVFKELE